MFEHLYIFEEKALLDKRNYVKWELHDGRNQ